MERRFLISISEIGNPYEGSKSGDSMSTIREVTVPDTAEENTKLYVTKRSLQNGLSWLHEQLENEGNVKRISRLNEE